MKKVKELLNSARTKATLATTAMVASGSALAQTEETGNEAAVQTAIDGGISLVQLTVGGVIGIAAVVMGVAIVTRLIGR